MLKQYYILLVVVMCALLASAFRHSSLRGSSKLSFSTRSKLSMSANPLAVVTGASRGIGRAIALTLGEAGCNVVVNYASSEAAALEVVEEIKQRGAEKGVNAIALKANVANMEEVQAMFKEITSKMGTVEILVNNAGITKDMLMMMMKQKDYTDVINLNLNGVFYCSQAASSLMLRAKRGRIVNIASIIGQIGNPGQVNYAAAKGGVLGMTKAMAKELGSRGITVNAVCPGFIESDMTKDLANKDQYLNNIPLKRFGKPEEVAGLVKFLALDPAASYITGHSFNVDGGLAIGST